MNRSYELKPTDYLHATLLIIRLMARKYWFLFPVFVFLFVGIIRGDTTERTLIVGGIAVFVYLFFHSIFVTNRNKGVYGIWTINVNSDGIRFMPPSQNHIYLQWTNTKGIYVTKKFVFVMTAPIVGLMIPRSALNSDDEAELLNVAGSAEQSGAPNKAMRVIGGILVYILALLLIVAVIQHFVQSR